MGMPWDLRHPSRLTVLALAGEARDTVFYVLRAARRATAQAVDRRRLGPGCSRIGSPAAGSSG